MKVVYQAWTEWDFGLGEQVFETKEKAWAAIKQAHIDCNIEDSFEDCLADGLYSVGTLTLT